MIWVQQYNPLGHALWSTLVAALPLVCVLGCIAALRVRIHLAAGLGLALALLIAGGIYGMPWSSALATGVYGAGYGLFPIGWLILNIMFLYQLTVRRQLFEVLRHSLARVAPDPRIQLLLVAFSFGAFLEGMAGFGAPVAITAALLIQLGFRPLQASAFALIANTAPVAFGSLGIPITTLSQVTGMDVMALSKMVGRQLPFFSVLVPFWLVCAFAGWRGLRGVWPAVLTAGVAFAVPQFLISNLHGPWLVDMVAGAISMGAIVILLRFWQPKEVWQQQPPTSTTAEPAMKPVVHSRREVFLAWQPWIILCVCIFIWGLPPTKAFFEGKAEASKVIQGYIAPEFKMANLHERVQRAPPVAPSDAKPEAAVFKLNWLSATGTGILVAGIIAGLLMGYRPREMVEVYRQTLWQVRYSLLTIAAMLALGNVTKYSGIDATLGLAMAKTGSLYPFFGTLLGWLGVALTGSDTASNVLFGSLQKITAEQTGLSPILMGAANSSGGVMGKMIDAQSIVVASTATNQYGQEGPILRYVFWHSLALAALVGILVYLQACVPPFTRLVVGAP